MPRVDLPNLLRSQAGYGVLFIYHKHKCVVAKGHINQLHARVRRCLPLVGVGIGSQHQIDRVRIIHHNALAFDSGKRIGLALRQPVIGIGRGGEMTKPFMSPSSSPSHCRASSMAMGTHTVLPSMLG